VPAEWVVASGQTPYPDALATMEARAQAIAADEAGEMVWLVEHPPLYTAGTGARIEDLVDPTRFPSLTPDAAANTPITAPASASSM
jgi:lipoyl(octanoyl) transferase